MPIVTPELKLNFDHVYPVVEAARQQHRENPDLRMGQSIFNTLFARHPALANEVRGSEVDPFYIDENLEAFFKEICTEEAFALLEAKLSHLSEQKRLKR